MLIQNISSAASGFTGSSEPVAVAVPRAQAAPPGSPPVAARPVAQPTPEQLKSAVDSLNRAMRQSNANVEFSIDRDTKQTVIKVVESQTGQLIRQFPSEEILAVSRMIGEMQQGLLVKQKA